MVVDEAVDVAMELVVDVDVVLIMDMDLILGMIMEDDLIVGVVSIKHVVLVADVDATGMCPIIPVKIIMINKGQINPRSGLMKIIMAKYTNGLTRNVIVVEGLVIGHVLVVQMLILSSCIKML